MIFVSEILATNKSRLLGAMLSFSLALHNSVTEAAVVTVEPDDFQEGQALTNVREGVTLSVANGDGIPQPNSQVVTFQGDYSSTGSLVFGRQVTSFLPDDSWFLTSIFVHSIFRADFDVPVAQVSIDVVRKQPKSGALFAYDSSDTLLHAATTAVGDIGTFATATIIRPHADIAYVLAGGYPVVSGPPFNVVTLDNFQFSQVPSTVPPVKAEDYFPLETGDQWTYQVNGNPNINSTASVLAGTVIINGVPTKMLQTEGPLGTTTNYFTNDDKGIQLHRQINDLGTVTFSPPIQLANSTTSLGDEFTTGGTAILFSPGQGTFQLDYTATSRIPGLLTTAAPAGQFNTVKVELHFTITGSVLGSPIDIEEVDTYWLAQYIGAVKATVLFEGSTTKNELLSAQVDHDFDGVSATSDNCPQTANLAQLDSDNDGVGNACENIADISGLSDISGDGVPDIAQLPLSGQPRVHYFSGASRQKISAVSYLGQAWTGVAAATVADSNSDGVANDPAVAVLAHKDSAGKHAVEVRRADNGALINKIDFFSARWDVIDVAVIDDKNGDGVTGDTAIAVLGFNRNKPFDQQIKVQVRRLLNGKKLANWFFLNGNWQPLALDGVNRIGRSALLVVLANKATTGANLVQARKLSNGSVQRDTSFFNANWLARDVAILLDSNGVGGLTDPAYLVLANHAETGRNKVQVRRVSDGEKLKKITMLGTNWDGQRIAVTADISGNLLEEVGVLAEKKTDDTVAIQLKDYEDRTTTATIFP
jgi:hypothetical protein